jgi:cytochrome c-type biogenesis protein CcmH
MNQRKLGLAVALCATLTWGGWVQASVAVYPFDDPALEQRFQRLTAELRCLVCQNQSLADSNADLAEDLRRQVYDMLRAGSDDRAIVDFMVVRYGEFVLYRPPLQLSTYLLWFGPFLLLAGGLVVLIYIGRRRRRLQAPVLPKERAADLRRLLEGEET